jgi:hypothetical protein
MKKLSGIATGLILLLCIAPSLSAQFTYKIKADSVRLYNDNCNAELIIENSTRNINGFLFNYGNGRTRFVDISGLFQPLENQRLSTVNSPTFTNQVLTGAQLRFINGANDIVVDGSDPGTVRSHYIKFRSQTADKGVGLQTVPGGINNNVPYEFDFCTAPDGSAAFTLLGDGPRQTHTIASLGTSGTAWPMVFQVNPGIDPTAHQYDVIRLLTDRSIQFPQLGAGYLTTDANGKVSVVNDIHINPGGETLQSVTDRGNATSQPITANYFFTATDASFRPTFINWVSGQSNVAYDGKFTWYTSHNNTLHKGNQLLQLRASDVGESGENIVAQFTGDGRAFILPKLTNEAPTISLAIGDYDTGLDWVGDGVLNMKANGVTVAQYNSGSFDFKMSPTVNGNPIWSVYNFDPNSKANTSGYYSGLSAGNADNAARTGSYTEATGWWRRSGDAGNVSLYGNNKTMIFRTDGNNTSVGDYSFAFEFTYGGGDPGSGSEQNGYRKVGFDASGRIWSSYHGWLDDAFLNKTDFSNHVNNTDIHKSWGLWSTNGGQDLLGRGKRAMVALEPGPLIINYGNDFGSVQVQSGVDIGGQLNLAKYDGYTSKINFPAQANDPGYIKHYENNNLARMYFSVSDDPAGTQDYFSFGAEDGNGFHENLNIYANGQLNTAAGIYAGGHYITTNNNIRIDAGGVFSDNWFRAYGQSGFYFQDYGGGWQMTDNTWIRAYNGKSITTPGTMDAGRFSLNNNTYGNCYITTGTGDGAWDQVYNMAIASWWGIGFVNALDGKANILFNVRDGSITSQGDVNIAKSVSASGFYETSDLRLKNVLNRNNTRLNILDQLQLIEFKWKDNRDQLTHYGYGAQDIQRFMPDAVTGKEHLSVNYEEVHSVAIDELIRKIKTLEARIQELESKSNKL